MPTMKQLDDIIDKLAQKFNFSKEEARRFLNLPVEVKSNLKPGKSSSIVSKDFPTSSKQIKTSRPASAYQNFVKAESAKVRDILIAQSRHSKIERGELQKELGSRWKAMSANEKANYTK